MKSVLVLWSIIFLVVVDNLIGLCFGLVYEGCSLGTDQVVSYDSSLIHPSNVTASSQELVFNPDDNLFHRYNSPLRLWCTEDLQAVTGVNASSNASLAELLGTSSARITINVTFTRPLLLTHILSSGFVNGFVKSFTIQKSLDLEGPFSFYHSSDGRRTFEVRHINTVLSLSPPIAARRILFDILDGVLTPTFQLCWHLTLLGCTLNEAIPLQDPAVASQVPQSTKCIRVGTISTSSPHTPLASLPLFTSASCPVVTTTKTVPAAPSVSTTAYFPEIMPTPQSSSLIQTSFDSLELALPLPSSCPVIITQTVEVGSGQCVESSEAVYSTSNLTSIPASTALAGPVSNGTQSRDNESSSKCNRYRLTLYVVPSVAVGLLILACLGFACVSGYIHCRCKSEKIVCSKDESGIMMDNALYESRDQAGHIPKENEDTLGMIDNELYKTRSSMLPASVLNAKHSPSLDHSNSFNGVPRRHRNNAYDGGNGDAMYENCRRFYTASKRSTFGDSMNKFGDSMNNRSTVTTDLEQSIRSVDSMVDNPTYSVPFPRPVDYHAVSIYPQKSPPKCAYNIPTTSSHRNYLTKGVSAIDMVDNECYCVPSSLSGQDEMEHSLMARQQFLPSEYGTPK